MKDFCKGVNFQEGVINVRVWVLKLLVLVVVIGDVSISRGGLVGINY